MEAGLNSISRHTSLPLVVITGPTASGKTSLAIEIASKFNGEIICADSRTVYRGLNIGTAKPTQEEQLIVPHWGIDLVEPGESYSVLHFKRYADQKIKEIRSRGHIPFLVGGTGLYIDSVIFDYQFNNEVDVALRQKMQQLSLRELYDYCEKNYIDLPVNYKNKRHVIGVIERNGNSNTKRAAVTENTVVVGISTTKIDLVERIKTRIDEMFQSGLIEEAKLTAEKYGWDDEAMKSNAYPLIHQYIDGDLTLDDVKRKLAVLDWRLAKRQMTWLKRNEHINWLSLTAAKQYLGSQLAIIKPT